jgi:hypothetical protein
MSENPRSTKGLVEKTSQDICSPVQSGKATIIYNGLVSCPYKEESQCPLGYNQRMPSFGRDNWNKCTHPEIIQMIESKERGYVKGTYEEEADSSDLDLLEIEEFFNNIKGNNPDIPTTPHPLSIPITGPSPLSKAL